MSIQRILSANMKRLRKNAGITQAKLAELIDSSTGYIAEIETQKKFPSPGKLEAIAAALNVEAYELLMPAADVLDSESKKTLTYRITKEIKYALQNIEKQYSSDKTEERDPDDRS